MALSARAPSCGSAGRCGAADAGRALRITDGARGETLRGGRDRARHRRLRPPRGVPGLDAARRAHRGRRAGARQGPGRAARPPGPARGRRSVPAPGRGAAARARRARWSSPRPPAGATGCARHRGWPRTPTSSPRTSLPSAAAGRAGALGPDDRARRGRRAGGARDDRAADRELAAASGHRARPSRSTPSAPPTASCRPLELAARAGLRAALQRGAAPPRGRVRRRAGDLGRRRVRRRRGRGDRRRRAGERRGRDRAAARRPRSRAGPPSAPRAAAAARRASRASSTTSSARAPACSSSRRRTRCSAAARTSRPVRWRRRSPVGRPTSRRSSSPPAAARARARGGSARTWWRTGSAIGVARRAPAAAAGPRVGAHGTPVVTRIPGSTGVRHAAHDAAALDVHAALVAGADAAVDAARRPRRALPQVEPPAGDDAARRSSARRGPRPARRRSSASRRCHEPIGANHSSGTGVSAPVYQAATSSAVAGASADARALVPGRDADVRRAASGPMIGRWSGENGRSPA